MNLEELLAESKNLWPRSIARGTRHKRLTHTTKHKRQITVQDEADESSDPRNRDKDADNALQDAKDATNHSKCKRTITNLRQGNKTEDVLQGPFQKHKE